MKNLRAHVHPLLVIWVLASNGIIGGILDFEARLLLLFEKVLFSSLVGVILGLIVVLIEYKNNDGNKIIRTSRLPIVTLYLLLIFVGVFQDDYKGYALFTTSFYLLIQAVAISIAMILGKVKFNWDSI